MNVLRVRFAANLDDPRPINWPVKYPYWVTGESDTHSFVVTYADNEKYVTDNWPEASDITSTVEDGIKFTDRFPCPKWYKENKL